MYLARWNDNWDEDRRINIGSTIRKAFICGGLLGFFMGFLFGMIAP